LGAILVASAAAAADASSVNNSSGRSTSGLSQQNVAAAEYLRQGQWRSYGGGPGGGQYAPLTEINATNVADLRPAWTYHTHEVSDGSDGSHPTTFQANPIVANGLLFFCTPRGRVIALQPETGAERWTFDPQMNPTGSILGAHICRGVAYWEDGAVAKSRCSRRVFGGTGDGRLFAVDASSGALCASFGANGKIDLNQFEYGGEGPVGLTSPPVVVHDTVIVGAAFPSYRHTDAPHGIVRAFDARSGKQLWSWDPIPAEARYAIGGVNVWAPMSADPDRNVVFLPTGSPTVDPYGSARATPIPYANAVVALDASSGEVRWHYQLVRHDLFDSDIPSQPILAVLGVGSNPVPVVIQTTKMGFVFVLHRDTGKPIFPVEERAVPRSDVPGERSAATQRFPTRPPAYVRQHLRPNEAWGLTPWDRGRCREQLARLRSDGLYTPPSRQGTVQMPGIAGGSNWGGGAFDPVRGILWVNATNIAFSSRLHLRSEFVAPAEHPRYGEIADMIDTPYVWEMVPIMSPLGIPCTPPPWGTLSAIDLVKGAITWQVPFGRMPLGPFRTPRAWGAPNMGGPLATAGGLIFIGATLDARMHAFSMESGDEIWSAELPAPGIATPMTFVAGQPPRQYVVIAAGGHAALSGDLGDTLVAFALPDRPLGRH